MVTQDRRCSECGNTMLLDKVKDNEGIKTFYYACVNPNCIEHGKSFTATGIESQSTIRDKE